jgi:hypothetical protein
LPLQKILFGPHLKKKFWMQFTPFFNIRFNISWNYMKINLSLFLDWGPAVKTNGSGEVGL